MARAGRTEQRATDIKARLVAYAAGGLEEWPEAEAFLTEAVGLTFAEGNEPHPLVIDPVLALRNDMTWLLDPRFSDLHDNPRLREIAGHLDEVSKSLNGLTLDPAWSHVHEQLRSWGARGARP